MSVPFRDQHLRCPACTDDVALTPRGQRFECGSCEGVFVDADALREMTALMTDKPPPAPRREVAPTNRKCPHCKRAMITTSLWTVVVDRCEPHGTWFDAKELALALEFAGGGLGPQSRWQRLFRELFIPRRQGARTPKRPEDI